MGLKVADIARIITEYRGSIGKKALPKAIKLDQVNSQVDFLSGLLKDSTGEDIKVTSQQDLQKVMRAVSVLSSISKQDNVDELNEKIAQGQERYARMMSQAGRDPSRGNILSSVEPITAYKSMRTLASIKESVANWVKKKDRVYLPPAWRTLSNKQFPEIGALLQYDQASQSQIRFYQQLAESLPPDLKIRAQSLLYNLNDPNTQIEITKQRNTAIALNMIKRIANENADKKDLVDNTIVSIASEDRGGDLSLDEQQALTFIETMSTMPERNEAFNREAGTFRELQSIFSTFRTPSQKAIAAANAANASKGSVKSILQKAEKGMTYEQLNDEEKKLMAAEGAKHNITPQYYYEVFMRGDDAAVPTDPTKKDQLIQKLRGENAALTGAQNSTQINTGKLDAATGKQADEDAQSTMVAKASKANPNAVPVAPTTEATTTPATAPTATSVASGSQPLYPKFIYETESTPEPVISPTPQLTQINTEINAEPKKPVKVEPVKIEPAPQLSSLNTLINHESELISESNPNTTVNLIRTVVNKNNCSTDFLQSEFGLNITEAKFVQDSLEELGVISPPVNGDINVRVVNIEKANENIEYFTNLVSTTTVLDDTPAVNLNNEPIAENAEDTLRDEATFEEAPEEEGPSEIEQFQENATEIFERLSSVTEDIRSETPAAATALPALATPSPTATITSASVLRFARQRREFDNLVARRQHVFYSRIQQLDFIGAFADMPELTSPTYQGELARWIGRGTVGLGRGIRNRIVNSETWIGLKKGIKRGITRIKHKIKTKTRLGRIYHRFSIFRNRLRRKNKSVAQWLVEEAVKLAIKGAIKGAIAFAQTVQRVTLQISQLSGIPSILANLTTSLYQKATSVIGVNVAAKVDQAFHGLSEGIKAVRNGFSQLGLFVGETAVVVRGAGRIIGSLLGAAPIGIISGLGASLTLGTGPGIAIGTMVWGTTFASNLLRQDHSAIINTAENFATRWGSHQWGGLGNFMHARANGVRGFFSNLQDAGSGSVKIENGQFTPATLEKINGRRGLYSGLQTGLEAGRNGLLTFSLLDPLLVAAFGPAGHILAVGGAITAGVGTVLWHRLVNKIYLWDAARGGAMSRIFAIPFMKTIFSIYDVGRLSRELTILRVKYNWDFDKYFDKEWEHNKNPWDKVFRGLEFGAGALGALNLPNIVSSWLIGLGATGFTGVASIFLPVLLATVSSLGILSALGMTGAGAMMGMAAGITGGAIIGFNVGVFLAGFVAAGTTFFGIGAAPLIISTSTYVFANIGGFLGGWLGNKFDQAFGNLIGYGQALFGGIQAIWELIMMYRRGINFGNVLQLMLSLMSVLSTLNYLQTVNGTNQCTTDPECVAPENTGLNTNIDLLGYYNVKVITSNPTTRQADITRIINLLDDNPTILDTQFGQTRQKYIYVGDTDDVYINDQLAIVAISNTTLYSPHASLKHQLDVYASIK